MDSNTVRLSALPADELWSIEYAEEMQEKAFNIGIPMVRDKEALLALIIHAWQWDKNAMIQYARILQNEDEIPPSKGESLDDFIIEHREQIVDRQGRLLNEPQVLRQPFWIFMELLAKRQYPDPAERVSSRIVGEMVRMDDQGNYVPFNQKEINTISTYLRYSIDGGYRNQEFLADTLLWGTGYGSINRKYEELNRVAEHRPALTSTELVEAIAGYRACASHGSSYCMTRLAEAYYHGIGVDKNLEYSCAWAKLSSQGYARYLESLDMEDSDSSSDLFEQHLYKIIDDYNSSIMELIEKEISATQMDAATALVNNIKSTVAWDYETWVRGRNPVPPMP